MIKWLCRIPVQNDLNALNVWSKTWDIDFNANKNVWCFKSKLVNVTMLLLLIMNLVTTIYFLLLAKKIWYHGH